MIIYLYKKTHNITGLKYLGKTTQDPFKYKGSGDYWIPHTNKHGYDVTTEIVKECQTSEEIKHWGLYYSELWNIVDERDENGKKTWANLKPEAGDGWAYGKFNPSNREDIKAERSANWSGKNNPGCDEKNKRYGDDNCSRRPEVKEKLGGDNHYMRRPNWDNTKHNSKNQNTILKRSGVNHWTHRTDSSSRVGYDSIMHYFTNEQLNKTVFMTKQQFRTTFELNSGSVSKLVSKKVKTCKGWRLVSS